MTRAQVEQLVGKHWRLMVGAAMSASLCVSDAEDAAAEVVEAVLRRHEHLHPAHFDSYLTVSARRAAVRIRQKRDRYGTLTGANGHGMTVDNTLERMIDRAVFGPALAGLKPQERTAVLDRVRGFSYREIMERRGWTYTKVNRCVTEGRAALREAVAA